VVLQQKRQKDRDFISVRPGTVLRLRRRHKKRLQIAFLLVHQPHHLVIVDLPLFVVVVCLNRLTISNLRDWQHQKARDLEMIFVVVHQFLQFLLQLLTLQIQLQTLLNFAEIDFLHELDLSSIRLLRS